MPTLSHQSRARTLACLLLASSLSASLAAQQPLPVPSRYTQAPSPLVPQGPIVFIPEEPGISPLKSPGKHVVVSRNEYGDRIESIYTIPPMQPSTVPPGRASIPDPDWGISAGSLKLPAGWNFVGSIHRDNPCALGEPEVAFRLTSPDGIMIEMTTSFFTSSVNAYTDRFKAARCIVTTSRPLSSATLLSLYILPSLYPGARILSQPEDTPNAAEWIKQSTGTLNGDRTAADAQRIRIGLTFQGHPSEGWVGAQTQFLYGVNYRASSSVVTTVIAPIGRLDEGIKVADGLDLQVSPEWSRKQKIASDQAAADFKKKFAHPRRPPSSPSLEDHLPGEGTPPIDPNYHSKDYLKPAPPQKPQ
jgi:hypothetical protein